MQSFEQSFTLQMDEENRSDINNFTSSPTMKPDTYLLETFHQHPNGDFRPTFYNPFEIKHRRRTSRAQLKILEKAFSEHPKPSATIRRLLAQKLEMTPRGVQIWFQNRRAKAKLQRKKSSVHNQQQRQNQQSSSHDEEDDDSYSDSNHSSKSSKSSSSKNISSSSGDISQSSILFSQFFANMNNNQNVHEFSSNTTSTMAKLQQAPPLNVEWNWQLNQQPISENARAVATVAAATAVATSSAPYEQNTTLTLGGESNWLAHDNNDTDRLFNRQQQSIRRKSCPVSNSAMMPTDVRLHQQQHSAFLSPSWSHSVMSRNKNCGGSGNTSPMVIINNFKRNFSYDSNSPSLDYYPMQDIHLNNYAPPPSSLQQQQLTPPLTASCSASTVAGSPISLDSIYNDPVAVPHNVYYNNSNNHISSPLSSTTLVTEVMPNFV